MTKRLNPNSSIPLYRQLAKDLIKKIDSSVYQPGEKIPSIRELAGQYDVSNITVVRALEELRQHQYVYSVHGKGYFISHHRVIQKYISRAVAMVSIRIKDRKSTGPEFLSDIVQSRSGARCIGPAPGRVTLGMMPGCNSKDQGILQITGNNFLCCLNAPPNRIKGPLTIPFLI